MQSRKDLFILIIGIIIYSVFYVMATFGYKFFIKTKRTFKYIFLISLFFGMIAYLVKIPLFYYYGQEDTVSLYILYISILTIMVTLYSTLILHEKVAIHTYIILFLIILLIVLNEYLLLAQKH